MLDRLRRRLTLLFSLLTAAVLGAALAVTCRMAQSQTTAASDLLFANTVAAVEDTVTGSGLVRDSWLARQEVAGQLVLYLEDNGRPLAFPGGWTPRDGRAQLIALAKEQTAAAGLLPALPDRQRVTVELAGDGLRGSYACTALVLPHEQARGAAAVYIIRDMTPLRARLAAMAWQYAGLWALGAAVLALACRWMVGRALRPTAQALQKQREFIAAAGHELRSPLTVLKAGLQAARDPATAADAPRFLRSAESEVDRLSRLTDDLLILAGGDAGVLRTALGTLPTDTFLIELYERFAPVARAQGHTLTLDLPDGALPTLHADAGRLEQLFAVLLNNAFEYAPAGTPVELKAACGAGGLRIDVIDHGPGVPDADKQRVFERFTRGDPSRTGKTHFGLGLAVAAEIAALHGADLTVRDTPGGGATFTVRWPAPGRR
ncbi:MAG: sensor histidine kinase [Blautia massiliensis (ex Durand et al. 2017)]